jgi:hypothetical protein
MSAKKVFFVEHPAMVSEIAYKRLTERLEGSLAGTELEGSKFIILEEGMRFAGVEEFPISLASTYQRPPATHEIKAGFGT